MQNSSYQRVQLSGIIKPFPRSRVPLFQNESKSETTVATDGFDFHEHEPVGGTYFHMKVYEWFRI